MSTLPAEARQQIVDQALGRQRFTCGPERPANNAAEAVQLAFPGSATRSTCLAVASFARVIARVLNLPRPYDLALVLAMALIASPLLWAPASTTEHQQLSHIERESEPQRTKRLSRPGV